jgi:hypothetical protein
MNTAGTIIGWTVFGLLLIYLGFINPVSGWGSVNQIILAIFSATGFLAWFLYGLLEEQRQLADRSRCNMKLIFTLQLAQEDEHSAWGSPNSGVFYKTFNSAITPTAGMFIYDNKLEMSFIIDRASVHLDDDTLYLYSKHIVDTREQLEYLIGKFKYTEWVQGK